MSNHDPRFPRPPHLERELERVARATCRGGADLYQRWYSLGLRHFRRAGENALSCWREIPEPEDFLHMWTTGVRDFYTDMVAASTNSVQGYAGDLQPGAGVALPATHEVMGKPVLLPARIRDARQAMAMWAVPAAKAKTALSRRLGEQAALFQVLDLGDGSSPFALFVVDYRESDLGSYQELGAAFFVRPVGDPGALPGMFLVDLPVDEDFSCEAGKVIWGYPKTREHITLDYQRERLHCTLRRGVDSDGALVLDISFPRGGSGTSSDVPMPTYTLRNGLPCLTRFSRSGTDETIRACSAGAVTLELGPAGDPMVDMLKSLGVAKAAPMLHGWTEHMSGEFGIPRLLAPV